MGDLYRDFDIVAVKKALGKILFTYCQHAHNHLTIIIAHFHDFAGSVKPRTRHKNLNSGQFYQYQSTNDSLHMFNSLTSFQSLLR